MRARFRESEGDGEAEFARAVQRRQPTESSTLLSHSATKKLNNSIQLFMAMCVLPKPLILFLLLITTLNPMFHFHATLRELHLQIKLIELQTLLSQTQHEPRLKGPFPIALYREILQSLQNILDKMHSMRCVTTREEWFTVRIFENHSGLHFPSNYLNQTNLNKFAPYMYRASAETLSSRSTKNAAKWSATSYSTSTCCLPLSSSRRRSHRTSHPRKNRVRDWYVFVSKSKSPRPCN